MCIPDALSDNDVQGPHLVGGSEAGQVGSQGLTEPLSLLPRALPAQPLLVEHLRTQTSSNEDSSWTQRRQNKWLSSLIKRTSSDTVRKEWLFKLPPGSSQAQTCTHLVAVFDSGCGRPSLRTGSV